MPTKWKKFSTKQRKTFLFVECFQLFFQVFILVLFRCWYLVQLANGNVQIGIFICSLIPDCNQKQWNEWLATKGAANNTDTIWFLSIIQKLSSEGMFKIMKSQPEFISVLDLEFNEFALFLTSILEIYLFRYNINNNGWQYK